MKFNLKAFAIALSALLLMLAPAMAGARTIYFLVGVRHVYRIGPDRDLFVQQREEIEKTYADGVAADEATYQQHVSGGADPAAEAQARDGDLALLAEDRDKALGAIFDLRDDIRAQHPELQIQGDGPYQVMGIDYHMNHNVMVFDDFSVYAPWPGYVVVGAPYGGWAYGRVYQPGIFFNLYLGWHSNYVSIGAPVFFGGFYGHAGYVPFRGGAFVGGPRAYASYVQPGRSYFRASIGAGGFNRGVAGGFNPGRAANRGSFNRSTSGGSLPNRGSSTSSWNRATPGGYSHGGAAGSRTGGQPGGQRGGNVNRSTSGGYSHGSSGARGGSFGGSPSTNGGRGGSFGGSPSTSGGSSRPASTGSHSGGYSHGGSGSSSSPGRPSSSSGHSSSSHGSSAGGHSHGGSDDKKGHGH